MEKPEKILVTALKLFVAYGFHGTPTSRIASEAGVSNGTLFHYFKTKDELVVALYSAIKEELNQELAQKMRAGTTPEKLRTLFITSIEWGLENRDAFYFMQQFHFSPHRNQLPKEEIRRQTERHSHLLQEARQANLLKPLPLDLITTLLASQIDGTHRYLVENPLPAERQRQLLNDVFELTWSMVANPETR